MIQFVISASEQWCIVLHNLSMKQHRMVKVVEVRDCTAMPMSSFLRLISKFRHVLPVASMYPELVHRVVLLNATSAVFSCVAMFKKLEQRLVKREKREDKARLVLQCDWEKVAQLLSARGVCEWANIVGEGPEILEP